MLRAAATILVKDLRLRLRDRSVWIFAIVVPLGLTVLFSFIFPATDDLSITAAVVDLDGGDIAAGFTDGVLPALTADGLVELVELEPDEARAQVADGTIDVAWVIPEGLTERIVTGGSAPLEVLVAAGRTIEGEVARSVASAYGTEVTRIGLAVSLDAATGQAPDPDAIAGFAAAAAERDALVALSDGEQATGEPLDPTSYLAAGMAAFFVFFTVQFGVTGLLEERKLGTMPRLLAAPIRPAAIQLGKIAGAFLLGVVSMAVLAVASAVLLGADWGPTPGVVLLVLALVVAAIGVMALVGSFAKTAEQAGNLQSIVAVVLGLAGGVFFPVPGDSGVLRAASLISPHGWFIRGLDGQAASADWTVAIPSALAIVAFGVVAAVPAAIINGRRQTW